MNIDMGALHAIEVDRGISVEELVDTIKTALLTAYRHTEGHQPEARIDIDRKSGAVQVMARETDDEGNVISEWDDTPEGFGRVAATTARQVMLQRFRDAENERVYGEFSAREGDIVAGVVQRDARENARGNVVVRLGSESKGSDGMIRPAEQVPGESYGLNSTNFSFWRNVQCSNNRWIQRCHIFVKYPFINTRLWIHYKCTCKII